MEKSLDMFSQGKIEMNKEVGLETFLKVSRRNSYLKLFFWLSVVVLTIVACTYGISFMFDIIASTLG